MGEEQIVAFLKAHYDRDLRKQVVKSIQAEEKSKEPPNYAIINQIFSYVLKEMEWSIAHEASQWDTKPLDIMRQAFPKLETTKWYKDQQLLTKKNIKVEVNEPKE
jgi:hypothetical protein